MTSDADRFLDMSTLRGTIAQSQSEVLSATQFVSILYSDNKGDSQDALRCAKAEKGIAGKWLPPTQNSFALHLLHCVYSVFIWHHAHVAMCEIPPPTEFGNEKGEGGLLVPQMMT